MSAALHPSERIVHRTAAGALYEPAAADRPVDLDTLREDIRAGHRFVVLQEDTGAECTIEVLLSILTLALPDTLAWLAPPGPHRHSRVGQHEPPAPPRKGTA
ncbi:hypothetical protein [Streptomyces candidus]|uniref:PHA accumulation regulator DNA-binding N-terminal domain-containing protein n=1 Tax=Streptomyces candidus TaxID=67283 RepID=A0A7X0HP60_9ACTN|nr:hypothetical protein [Streptomyces candidus]MBB6440044.1 hypothetical protein [Streptomyces candidus]